MRLLLKVLTGGALAAVFPPLETADKYWGGGGGHSCPALRNLDWLKDNMKLALKDQLSILTALTALGLVIFLLAEPAKG